MFVRIKKLFVMIVACVMPALWSMQRLTPEQQLQAVREISHAFQDNRLLFWAMRGDVANLQASLTQGADINATDSHGNTALMLAISAGNSEVINFLLSRPELNINIQNESGMTALAIAALSGFTPLVKELLDRGADLPSERLRITEELQNVIRGGESHWLSVYNGNELEKNIRVALYKKTYPFIVHLLREHEQKLRSAIAEGISVAHGGERKAETEKKEREQKHAVSTQGSECQVVTSLVQSFAGVPEMSKKIRFINAARRGDLEQVRSLLTEGIDVNTRDEQGRTALMYVIQDLFGDVREQTVPTSFELQNKIKEITEKFLKNQGREPTQEEIEQEMKYYKIKPYYDLVQLLVDAGANLNAQDNAGNYLVWFILSLKKPEVLEADQNNEARKKYFTKLFGEKQKNPRTLEWEEITSPQDLTYKEREEVAALSKEDQVFVERMQVLKLLLNRGIDIRVLIYGLPLLTNAINYHDWYLFKALLAAGAQDDEQRSAAVAAIVKDDPRLLIELFQTQYQDQFSLAAKLNLKIIAGIENKHKILDFFKQLDQSLIEAVKNNDIQRVYKTLNRGAYPNARDEDAGNTPLIYAAGNGNSIILATLLQYGASIDEPRDDGVTPLMWATLLRKPAVVNFLLLNGANPDTADTIGRNFFTIANLYPQGSSIRNVAEKITRCRQMITAIDQGNERRVSELIAQDRSLVVCSYENHIPLAHAIQHGHLALVQLLLHEGATPNVGQDISNLIRAVQGGNVAIVQALLKAGADIDIRNRMGATAEDYARTYSSQEMVALFEDYKQFKHNLLEAFAHKNEKQIVELLLQSPVYVNIQTEDSNTPLRLALIFGFYTIADTLLNLGAHINENQNPGHTTPLMQLAWNGNVQAIDFLLDHGAGIDLRDIEGHTALMYAAQVNQLESVKRLLAAGADPSLIDNQGNDILRDINNPEIVKLIQEARVAQKVHAERAAELRQTVLLLELREKLAQEEYEMTDEDRKSSQEPSSKKQRK